MAYKLAIADVIGVKVKGKYTDEAGVDKPLEFVLFCDRCNAEEMKAAVSDKDETAFDFFDKHASGWKGQKLVLEEDGTPAAFSADALKALMSISGMAALCWHSYVQQVQATAKN
jgi:hypothetical protein